MNVMYNNKKRTIITGMSYRDKDKGIVNSQGKELTNLFGGNDSRLAFQTPADPRVASTQDLFSEG